MDSSGKFEMDGMAPGKYLPIILQKDRVVATKPLDILRGEQSMEMTVRP